MQPPPPFPVFGGPAPPSFQIADTLHFPADAACFPPHPQYQQTAQIEELAAAVSGLQASLEETDVKTEMQIAQLGEQVRTNAQRAQKAFGTVDTRYDVITNRIHHVEKEAKELEGAALQLARIKTSHKRLLAVHESGRAAATANSKDTVRRFAQVTEKLEPAVKHIAKLEAATNGHVRHINVLTKHMNKQCRQLEVQSTQLAAQTAQLETQRVALEAQTARTAALEARLLKVEAATEAVAKMHRRVAALSSSSSSAPPSSTGKESEGEEEGRETMEALAEEVAQEGGCMPPNRSPIFGAGSNEAIEQAPKIRLLLGAKKITNRRVASTKKKKKTKERGVKLPCSGKTSLIEAAGSGFPVVSAVPLIFHSPATSSSSPPLSSGGKVKKKKRRGRPRKFKPSVAAAAVAAEKKQPGSRKRRLPSPSPPAQASGALAEEKEEETATAVASGSGREGQAEKKKKKVVKRSRRSRSLSSSSSSCSSGEEEPSPAARAARLQIKEMLEELAADQPTLFQVTAANYAASIRLMRAVAPELSDAASLFYLQLPTHTGRGNAYMALAHYCLYPFAFQHFVETHRSLPLGEGHLHCLYCNKYQHTGLAYTGLRLPELGWIRKPAIFPEKKIRKAQEEGYICNTLVMCQTCSQSHSSRLHQMGGRALWRCEKTQQDGLVSFSGFVNQQPLAALYPLTPADLQLTGPELEKRIRVIFAGASHSAKPRSLPQSPRSEASPPPPPTGAGSLAGNRSASSGSEAGELPPSGIGEGQPIGIPFTVTMPNGDKAHVVNL